jgi:DNA-binding XRE family transcriptional regulator
VGGAVHILDVARTSGKPANFTAEQLSLLRAQLASFLREHPKLSQGELGAVIGVGQQTVSSFMRGKTGLSYNTATEIATLTGYDGVDDLFQRHGLWHDGGSGANDIPIRRTAAKALALQGKMTIEEYEAIRGAPELNGPDARQRDMPYWSAVLEFAAKQRRAEHETLTAAREKRRTKKRPA